MSGHSKWSTIKNKKGKTDAIKGKIYTKISKLIAIAARDGSDINSNAKLKEAVNKAKAANMPNGNIERAIKKGSGELGGQNFESITYEGYGIGGVAVTIEALTDNKNRTAGDIRYIFDKNGGNLGTSGCVSFMFETKGTILISSDKNYEEDEIMLLALDNGAQDFETSEEGFEITTSKEDFHNVLKALEENNVEPTSASIDLIPTTYTKLEKSQIKSFEKMLDMFDEQDDVQEVYHNAEY